MPLSDILAAIDAATAAEARRIEARAATAVAATAAEAERDAAAIRERRRREVEPTVVHERARRLNRARLAALRARSEAREALFAEALARARERLAHTRQTPEYPGVLASLVHEALAQLDGGATLRADPRDAALLADLAPGVTVSLDLDTWGGVEARTADGRVVVVNTLEARLAQAESQLRAAVMPLFDGDKPRDRASPEPVAVGMG